MKPFIRPLFLFFLVFFTIQNLNGQTISGKVTDAETGELLVGANLVFFNNDLVYLTGTSTDFDGNYRIQVDSSAAWIEVSYAGYQQIRESIDQRKKIHIALEDGDIIKCVYTVLIDYKIPLINLDSPTSGQVFGGDQIRNSAY